MQKTPPQWNVIIHFPSYVKSCKKNPLNISSYKSKYETFFIFFVQCVQCNNGPSSMKSGALTNIAKHSFVMLQNR